MSTSWQVRLGSSGGGGEILGGRWGGGWGDLKGDGQVDTLNLSFTIPHFRPSGMTGTAATEVSEFDSIYKLPVAVVPTNRPADVREGDGRAGGQGRVI